ncbi:hypothetical protein LAZ67_5002883 [Cordylochernes scorpioides]|uniref:Uncharacterized protein n=1 Tax=Cordylochernes scorpioides TaxID=51811 RepID=A0ABY6KJU6_9ARAC|nr:hypothetical protein LAZ67_5002883 [Cordylochernes scorpioides]
MHVSCHLVVILDIFYWAVTIPLLTISTEFTAMRKFIVSRFKIGEENIEYEERHGQEISVNTEKLVTKTIRMLAEESNINRETIRQILVENLGKKKIVFSARFVSHFLSDDQKHERIEYSKVILKIALVETKIN